jgi:hypothetical protein
MGNNRRRKRRNCNAKIVSKKIGKPESHPEKEIEFMPFRPWDSIDDVIPVMKASMSKELPRKWSWVANSICKYIELRIDMRDGGCIIKNRRGERITPAELEYQYGKKHEELKKYSLEQFEKNGYDKDGFGGDDEILCPYCATLYPSDGVKSDDILNCSTCDNYFNVEVIQSPVFNTTRIE